MHAGALILIEGKKGTIIFKGSVLANANFEIQQNDFTSEACPVYMQGNEVLSHTLVFAY